LFSEDLGICTPNGKIHTQHMDGMRLNSFIEGRESPVPPGGKREGEKALGSFGMSFLYHLELGDGETLCHHLASLTCGLRVGAFEPRGGAVQDYP
jgi:hypothetical protein